VTGLRGADVSFLYTDEQRQIGESARRRLASSYSAETLKRLLDDPGRCDESYWRVCQEMGWPAMAIPEDYGGLGLGLIEMTIVAEAAGRVACGAPYLLTSYAAAQAILLAGDLSVKAAVVPRLASGEQIGTIAFAEDANPISLRPTLVFDGQTITGTKRGVLGGSRADLAVALAVRDSRLALVLVDLTGQGVSRGFLDTFDNSRNMADLTFTNAAALPLDETDALSTAWSVLDRAAVVLAAEELGGADACMELARDYANTRQAFGQPIGKFQAIKHKIAEMYVANQIARANCLESALRFDRSLPASTPLAAAARISGICAYDFASRESMQTFGGLGVTWESDLHLHLRRARSCASVLGSRFIWEDRLVAALEAEL